MIFMSMTDSILYLAFGISQQLLELKVQSAFTQKKKNISGNICKMWGQLCERLIDKEKLAWSANVKDKPNPAGMVRTLLL